ncbi:DNA polymerase IV [Pseudactinotalea suaedae]|uniref:DNA polymerase IV n=1 Tax=Pseudactinotalea suaedae TaxID=1524924 RepID=UPI0012E2A37D|nr:DNA polymerase IV [Pseudactinotalea suaedae]
MAGEESPTWWLFHVDLDQFLAAVEIRRRPELAGQAVVVGGDGDPTRARQVVATATYEARALGVHSGMPLRAALRKAPEAIFLPSDRPVYEAASAEVMDVLRSFRHPVEVWGWDEAFLGADVEDPFVLADEIRARVRERTRLSCAVGIGDTKERAKMATSFGKPGGVFRLSRDNWWEVMGARPARDLWGIGSRTAAKLADHGIATIADLGHADEQALAGWFGPTIGPGLRQLARGGASRTITTEPWVRRSLSKQVTYPADLRTREEVSTAVLALVDDVQALLLEEGRVATHVGVTVRTATFFTRTKTAKLAAPTTDLAALRERAQVVLERFELDRPVRLLGVRFDLADPG